MQRMLLAVLIWAIGVAGTPQRGHAQSACEAQACMEAGTRLASFDTRRSEILNAVLSSLSGSSIQLSVADYNALAGADINLDLFLAKLKADLKVVSVDDVLKANLSLETLLGALPVSALISKNGQLALTVLEKLIDYQLPSQTLALGELLKIDLRQGALAKATINLLDLVTGAITLFNHKHALKVEDVSVGVAALGIDVVKELSLGLVVPVPPVYTCGPEGSSFRSASIRLRARVDLVNVDTVALSLLNLPKLAKAELALGKLDLVVDVAPGQGVLQLVDAITDSVTVRATPGIVRVLLGSVSDADLIERDEIDASELDYATIGKLHVELLNLTLAQLSVQAKAVYEGTDPSPTNLVFKAPYPATKTAYTQADFVPEVLEKLLGSLEVKLSVLEGSVDDALNSLTSGVLNLLKGLTGPLKPVLQGLVDGLVNPLLEVLGVGLGELDVTVCEPYFPGEGTPCDDGQFCTEGETCNGAGSCGGGASPCAPSEAYCTQSVCDEATRSCKTEPSGCNVEGGCAPAGYRDGCYVCDPSVTTDDLVPLENCTVRDDGEGEGEGEGEGNGDGNEFPNLPGGDGDASNEPQIKSAKLAGGCSVSDGSQDLGGALLFLLALGLFFPRRRMSN